MPAIQVMIKPASGLCNMRCSYCFYADEMANRKQASYGIMSEQTLENVLTVVNGKTAPKIRRIYEQYRSLGLSGSSISPVWIRCWKSRGNRTIL